MLLSSFAWMVDQWYGGFTILMTEVGTGEGEMVWILPCESTKCVQTALTL